MTRKLLVRSCIAFVLIILFAFITLIPGKHSLRAAVPAVPASRTSFELLSALFEAAKQ